MQIIPGLLLFRALTHSLSQVHKVNLASLALLPIFTLVLPEIKKSRNLFTGDEMLLPGELCAD